MPVLPPRFVAKVHVTPAGCWEWTASRNKEGYGRFAVKADGRWVMALAHRVAYELFFGPMPAGLESDHLCRNRPCANPWHLEAVTHKENDRRGIAGIVNAARMRGKTHCPQGHPYDRSNTYVRVEGWRRCKECNRTVSREYQQRRRAVLAAKGLNSRGMVPCLSA